MGNNDKRKNLLLEKNTFFTEMKMLKRTIIQRFLGRKAPCTTPACHVIFLALHGDDASCEKSKKQSLVVWLICDERLVMKEIQSEQRR